MNLHLIKLKILEAFLDEKIDIQQFIYIMRMLNGEI